MLVRKVTITNQNKPPQTLEVLDGMPVILSVWFVQPNPERDGLHLSSLGPGLRVEDKTVFYHLCCHCRPGGRWKKVEAGTFLSP